MGRGVKETDNPASKCRVEVRILPFQKQTENSEGDRESGSPLLTGIYPSKAKTVSEEGAGDLAILNSRAEEEPICMVYSLGGKLFLEKKKTEFPFQQWPSFFSLLFILTTQWFSALLRGRWCEVQGQRRSLDK